MSKILILISTLSFNAYSYSPCMSTFLAGVTPKLPKYTKYNMAITTVASIPMLLEKTDNEWRNEFRLGFAAGMPLLIGLGILMDTCREVDDVNEYKKLLKERERLKNEGKPLGKLAYMDPIPTQEELKSIIDDWKEAHMKATRVGLGISLFLNAGMTIFSDNNYNKLISLGAAGITTWLYFQDIDGLYTDKKPYWADFLILSKKVGRNFVPSLNFISS